MSGGSMDYLYRQVEEANFKENTSLRKAFRVHLNKVAKAMQDIEWVDSGDCGPGDEDKAILDCITKTELLEAGLRALDQAIVEAVKIKEVLGKAEQDDR